MITNPSSQPSGSTSDPGIQESRYHQTPNGIPVQINCIASEISANTQRLGFTEPSASREAQKLNGYELMLCDMFTHLIVPYSKACEAARKGNFEALYASLDELGLNAGRLRNRYKPHITNELAHQQHLIPTDQAWERVLWSKLALVPTELAEIYTSPEHDLHDLDDAIIRILSLGSAAGHDFDAGIAEEMAHNATREAKHGKHA